VVFIFVPATWWVLDALSMILDFLAKLKEIEGYIVSDVESFPNVPFWIFAEDHGKKIGIVVGAGRQARRFSRATALKLLESA